MQTRSKLPIAFTDDGTEKRIADQTKVRVDGCPVVGGQYFGKLRKQELFLVVQVLAQELAVRSAGVNDLRAKHGLICECPV